MVRLTPELSGGGETTPGLCLHHRAATHRCPPGRFSAWLSVVWMPAFLAGSVPSATVWLRRCRPSKRHLYDHAWSEVFLRRLLFVTKGHLSLGGRNSRLTHPSADLTGRNVLYLPIVRSDEVRLKAVRAAPGALLRDPKL